VSADDSQDLSADHATALPEFLRTEANRALEEQGFVLERIQDEHDNSDSRLVLSDLSDPKLLPLAVDFLSGQLEHRRAFGLGKAQPFPRALGLKAIGHPEAPFILDATAGLGTDAFIMSVMGCKVRAVERNPIVFQLLEDGYRRLRRVAEMRANEKHDDSLLKIADRLSFEFGTAREILENLDESNSPDVVYLDPMYPEEGRSKSALPKKAMQIFRRLIGDDFDTAEVFGLALRKAKSRVVVKRPLHAPALSEQIGDGEKSNGRPQHVFAGKTARFDMYLVPKKRP
jgi:16S rRNA (guanine1516-N2)-methyltransferase